MEDVYYQNAVRIGASAAERLAGQLPLTPEQAVCIVERFGLKVIIIPLGSVESSTKIRAIYDPVACSITIQKTSLRSFREACVAAGFGPVGYMDVLAMHVAHELFHHLEQMGLIPFSSYYNLHDETGHTPRQDGVRVTCSRVMARLFTGPSLVNLREVAAHSFVTTLLGLSVSPSYIENWRQNVTETNDQTRGAQSEEAN